MEHDRNALLAGKRCVEYVLDHGTKDGNGFTVIPELWIPSISIDGLKAILDLVQDHLDTVRRCP